MVKFLHSILAFCGLLIFIESGGSIVLHPGNLKISDGITCLPCYMAGFL